MQRIQQRAPDINFHTNYDSSGTLMTQIKEGAKCNIFFSAGVEQMDELEKGYDGGSVDKDNRKEPFKQSGVPCNMERK